MEISEIERVDAEQMLMMMGSSYEPEQQPPHLAAAALPVNEEWPLSLSDDDIRKNSRSQTGKRLADRSRKTTGHVLLEGYVGASKEEAELTRAKSLTDDDLDELRGCLDLGFGFSYEEIPQLCSTLPALELCYSMNQRFLDEQRSRSPEICRTASSSVASWRISAPGE